MLKVVAEDIRSQARRHVNSCFLTMVAVDDAGRSAAVPPLQPATTEEIRRNDAARLRRELRQELATRFAATRSAPQA